MSTHLKILTWILFLILLVFSAKALASTSPKPFVVPELKEWKGSNGFFVPSSSMKIIYTSNDKQLITVAQQFADDYQKMFNQHLEIVKGKPSKGNFVFTLKSDKKLGKEGYTIKISDGIVFSAPTPQGLYWGTRTILQLMEQSSNRQLAKGTIRDYPYYPVRGFMLDCGRKYIPMSYLKDLVKVMSYYKMNVLHLHLNDNGVHDYFNDDWQKTYAAFRLESDTYPGLTACDGSYTKKEFRDFQKGALMQNVEIIPEIDVPAHSLAFTHYKPEIGSKEYGMDHLDLFNPETYTFLDGLFKEYLEGDDPVFCGKRVNIGTDEYSNKDKKVVEKFRYFTDRYIRYVESFGKQACLWGSLTHANGDTPVKSENVIMGAWYNGYADPATMMKQGYHLISMPDSYIYIVPATGYYNDYLNEPMLYNEWTPAHIGKAIFEEKNPSILGGMFAEWNDHVGNGITVKDIHHRVFPAIQTLTMKLWNAQKPSLSYDEFKQLRSSLSEAPGVNQLGKIGKPHSLVYERQTVEPSSQSEYQEIGYNYTVSFDIEAAEERQGTVLFRSPNAVFYLSDPVKGMIGFSRDGYLNNFFYKIKPGDKVNIQIKGDNKCTTLFVNGKLVESLTPRNVYTKDPEKVMHYMSTLVFPLAKAGRFKSKIHNLKVYNYCLEQ
jgi:hexosaminidase